MHIKASKKQTYAQKILIISSKYNAKIEKFLFFLIFAL